MSSKDAERVDDDDDEDGADIFAPTLTTNFPFPPEPTTVPVCITTVKLSGQSSETILSLVVVVV